MLLVYVLIQQYLPHSHATKLTGAQLMGQAGRMGRLMGETGRIKELPVGVRVMFVTAYFEIGLRDSATRTRVCIQLIFVDDSTTTEAKSTT